MTAAATAVGTKSAGWPQIPLDSWHQFDAQLRAAQCAAVRRSRGDLSDHHYHGRRLAAPAGGDPRLLEKLAEGYDVVYAAPQEGQHGFWRNTAARVTKLALQSVLGAETAGKVSPFRAFRTRLRMLLLLIKAPLFRSTSYWPGRRTGLPPFRCATIRGMREDHNTHFATGHSRAQHDDRL